MGRVGALAQNFHEGSRSEYLAQYVFASFGTAIAVPHQEDTGVDLHCTLTERRGPLAWPLGHYTLQVKSSTEPWCFKTEDSVRWLIEHPLPLFLCIVDKRRASIRVYHTCPRFELWAAQHTPPSLELVPSVDEREGRGQPQWDGWTRCSLGAPIIDVTLADLLQDDAHTRTKAVLINWLGVEQENLTRLRIGQYTFSMPCYATNSPDFTGRYAFTGFAGDPSVPLARMAETAGSLVYGLMRRDDLLGAALCAMVDRYARPEETEHLAVTPLLNQRLGGRLGLEQSTLGTVEPVAADYLLEAMRRMLQHEPPYESAERDAAADEATGGHTQA